MKKKIDFYLIISDEEEEKDKGVSCVAQVGITNYSINEKRSVLAMDAVKFVRLLRKEIKRRYWLREQYIHSMAICL